MKLFNIIFKFIFSRMTIFIVSILLQLFIYAGIYMFFYEYIGYFYILFLLLSFITIIELLNDEQNPMFKISWILLILSFPIFGIITYILLNNQLLIKEVKKRIKRNKKIDKNYLSQDNIISDKLKELNKEVYNLHTYMYNNAIFPVYNNTDIKYYPSGEEWFEDYIKELQKAKEYIFLEYFIVANGKFWNSVLEVLKSKASEGVEVYFMYDGMCEISLLPHNYPQIMKSYGIKCKPFHKVVPLLSTYQNNRDHRKITVIDGKVAFTGGTNIADEYINVIEKHGYWKDATIKLEGEAVKTFVVLFLSMWNLSENKIIDAKKYLKDYKDSKGEGYIIPFGDIPHDGEEISKKLYLDLINTSKERISIMTPYLILDYELTESLKYAAKRGVKVELVLPHIPDKWYAYVLARSYYHELLTAGVNIYEFTPGFVHSKVLVSDNDEAIVGSVNLDYRSFFLHFEAGAYIYNHSEINNIVKDFDATIKQCEKITIESNKKFNKLKMILGRIFRIFAPLM